MVSADGMLADAHGVMPPSMLVEADQAFFEHGLDRADVVVHGRNSQEDQRNSPNRRRVILTRAVPSLAPDPANPNAVLWNPAGASFEEALAAAGATRGTVAVIGGTDVFGLLLPYIDAFHLSRIDDMRLPRGRPVFPQVPERTPEQVLAAAGMRPGARRVLDAARQATLVTWERD